MTTGNRRLYSLLLNTENNMKKNISLVIRWSEPSAAGSPSAWFTLAAGCYHVTHARYYFVIPQPYPSNFTSMGLCTLLLARLNKIGKCHQIVSNYYFDHWQRFLIQLIYYSKAAIWCCLNDQKCIQSFTISNIPHIRCTWVK